MISPWVRLLLVANIALFVATNQSPELADMLAFVPSQALIRPWTPITYMFVHAGFGHIFFNMISLLVLGPRVEDRLGSSRFITLYTVSGLSGAALSALLQPEAAIVGASGAVFGVMLAYARFWPRTQLLIWGIFPVSARTLVVILTVLSIAGGRGFSLTGSNIAHFAHLGGFLGGWLMLRIYGSSVRDGVIRPVQTAAPRAAAPAAPSVVERWKRIALDRLHPVNREEVERVLAKLESNGVAGLTADEQLTLDRFSPP
jgi:membrane associated rhomboid family serine protease